MILAPEVNSGSYFNAQDRTSRRLEWLTTYSFTPIGPRHLLKVGGGATYETFNGSSRSQPVDLLFPASEGDDLTARIEQPTGLRGQPLDVWWPQRDE